MRHIVLALSLLSLLLAAPLVAAEGFSYPLFNGQDLQGWVITGCQVGVESGSLVLQGGDGFARTEHRYRDFVLELQWKPRQSENFDSGIYFHSELPREGKHWPERYQVNLRQNQEGNLIGNRQGVSQGLVQPNAWNRLKLTVIGPKASLELNGKPAWSVDNLEARDGYIGLQSEVPLGGQFEFKEIVITELGFKSLFNGQDMTGWEGADAPAEKCWKVADGLLTCTGEKGPWLRSMSQPADFNLRLEYKLRPGGNSGVYVRVPKDGDHHGDGAGVEIQVLDDQAERYKTLKPYQYTGSVYAIVPADPRVARAAGEWNSLEIDCRGSSYQVFHNGVRIIKAESAQFPELSRRRAAGYLGLQNHSEEVWYRQIRLGPSAQSEIQVTDTQRALLKTFRDEFVDIAPGTAPYPAKFRMGNDQGSAAERPAHEVTLSRPFGIAKYEVPQNLWEAVMGSNPSKWKGARNSVEMVTLAECQDFCRQATDLMRAAKLIDPVEFIRLPTEAEWEYVARGGTETVYSFGDDKSQLGEYAWSTENAAGNDPPVGAKKANPWGLHDIHGYLWEWCLDSWQADYTGSPGDGTARPAAENAAPDASFVARGGSWKDPADRLTSSFRRSFPANAKDDALGLRCVLAR